MQTASVTQVERIRMSLKGSAVYSCNSLHAEEELRNFLRCVDPRQTTWAQMLQMVSRHGLKPSWSNSKLLEIRRHRVVLVRSAGLALAPYQIVLADAPPSAILACAPSLSVLADARPSALLA